MIYFFVFLCVLCAFVVKMYLLLHFRRPTPVYPPYRYSQFSRGGYTRGTRGIRVNSAASAEPAAMHKCQFSGISRAPPLSFRRINVQMLHFVQFLNQKG